MNQTKVIELAMQAKGFTTAREMAHAMGIDDQRINNIKTGKRPLDEAEAIMLAEWTELPLSVLLAACALDREKQPTKRSFLEKIARPFFASAVLLGACFQTGTAEARTLSIHTTPAMHYTHRRWWWGLRFIKNVGLETINKLCTSFLGNHATLDQHVLRLSLRA